MTQAPVRQRGFAARIEPYGRALLVLEDGTQFDGISVGAAGTAVGEAVFTTSMTGYQEALTDPSFHGQLVCFTAPMVGNYGVAPERTQSPRARAAGALMRSCTSRCWSTWLREEGVVAIADIDTRRLAMHLREHGSMRAVVSSSPDALDGPGRDGLAARAAQLEPTDWATVIAEVSTPSRYLHADGERDVAVLDLGVKRSLLQLIERNGCAVTVYPHDVDTATLRSHQAVVVSSGPGDPARLDGYLRTIVPLLGEVPMLGVCLGHQLLARALGHDTWKLPFGHRGTNHPVLDRRTGRVLVTSQNHGYAVAIGSAGAEVTHVSLYDGTVEGFACRELRVAGIQFHPEATPGPDDARGLVADWLQECTGAAQA
ncbi:MAG: carbamoyl-phosphate synthase, small subunit [Thermoleophilia bacterium]|nr:carbamoyl-phosphate synthase, small subunit [Thermoleophilia bacterium]